MKAKSKFKFVPNSKNSNVFVLTGILFMYVFPVFSHTPIVQDGCQFFTKTNDQNIENVKLEENNQLFEVRRICKDDEKECLIDEIQNKNNTNITKIKKRYKLNFKNSTDLDPLFLIGEEIIGIGNRISVESLLRNPMILFHSGDGNSERSEIAGYQILINPGKVDEEKFIIHGNIISNNEIELIQNGLLEGKEVAIDHMKLKYHDSINYYGMIWITRNFNPILPH